MLSTWIYLVHPLCIIMVRGAAKAAGLADLLVQNSVLHFLAVTALSVLVAAFLTKLSVLNHKGALQAGSPD
ncbi:hypothetical protein SDC9_201117 [bioreactor metagenome]|uniref:Uncharacterized protein n=1 Tax=bioreactor metagenome TaxID=1076179 RepID=A0A645J1X9_9ZZZZ